MMLVLVLSIPALLLQDRWHRTVDDVDSALDFIRHHREELRRQQPDYVMVGNSMLTSRIDPQLLEEVVGGRVYLLERDMSYSALWYLMLRDALQASGVRPKKVFLFFRDNYLTDPARDSSGQEGLRVAALEPESPLAKLLQQQQRLPDHLRTLLHQLYPVLSPLSSLPSDVRWLINNVAFLPVVPDNLAALAQRSGQPEGFRRFQRSRDAFFEEMEAVFHLDRMKPVPLELVSGVDIDPDSLNFRNSLDHSFLPLILELADKERWEMVFIRVKRRPRADGVRLQSPELRQYIADLRQYLEVKGHDFHDFSDDAAIREAYYQHGDHISVASRDWYTRHFAESVGEAFR